MSLAGYDAWKTDVDEEMRRHEAGTTEAAEDAALLRFVHGPSRNRFWIVWQRYGYRWDVVRAGSELAQGWQVIGSIHGPRCLSRAQVAQAILWVIVQRDAGVTVGRTVRCLLLHRGA